MTEWLDPKAVREQTLLAAVRGALARGGVVAFPTETYYGLAARADSEPAVRRVARLKMRPEGKPIPVIAASAADARRIGPIAAALAPLVRALWPGPLTVAVKPEGSWPAPLIGPQSDIGVRVPGHDLARLVARAGGGLVTATSANRAGMPPAPSSAELDSGLAAEVDVVVVGACPGGMPSTVVGLDADGRVELRRPGVIAVAALERVLDGPVRAG